MKKIISLLAFSLMMLQLIAQPKTVKFHGTVLDTSVKVIEIAYPANVQLSNWCDTVLNVVNGKFNTSFQIPFPMHITISYGKRSFSNNYIYNDAEVLIDSRGVPHLKGSPVQDEYKNEFLPFFQSNKRMWDTLRNIYAGIYAKYGDDIPKAVKDSAIVLQDKYYYGRAMLLNEYIKQHPNSYVALWDIYFFVQMAPTHRYFDFEKLFSSFSDQMQQQSFISALKEKIKLSNYMAVGQIFPNEFFKGYEQMHSKISENNQYCLIDFWYSHCGPCIAGFPKLKEIYNQFQGKGFNIVSISVDKQKDKKDYMSAIKKYELSWNHVWDKDGVTSFKFNIHAFPTYILLDKEGKIINNDIRTNELEEFLRKNL